MKNHSKRLLVLVLQEMRSEGRQKEDRKSNQRGSRKAKSWNKDNTMAASRRKEQD